MVVVYKLRKQVQHAKHQITLRSNQVSLVFYQSTQFCPNFFYSYSLKDGYMCAFFTLLANPSLYNDTSAIEIYFHFVDSNKRSNFIPFVFIFDTLFGVYVYIFSFKIKLFLFFLADNKSTERAKKCRAKKRKLMQEREDSFEKKAITTQENMASDINQINITLIEMKNSMKRYMERIDQKFDKMLDLLAIALNVEPEEIQDMQK